MLNTYNYISLLVLAFVSWTLLCVFSRKSSPYSYEKRLYEKVETQKNANQVLQWPESVVHSITSIDSNVMVYIACTLCGVLVIINVLRRKLNHIVESQAMSEIDNHMNNQVKILKLEKINLLKLIRNLKLEKKVLMQNYSSNKIIIRKLKHELRNAKKIRDDYMCNVHNYAEYTSNRYSTVQKFSKGKTLSLKQNKIYTSSSGIVKHYFNREIITASKGLNKYNDLELTTSNIEVINGILKKACCGNREREQMNNDHESLTNDKVTVKETDENTNGMLRVLNIVDIVSTDQLAYIKGLYLK